MTATAARAFPERPQRMARGMKISGWMRFLARTVRVRIFEYFLRPVKEKPAPMTIRESGVVMEEIFLRTSE